MHYTTQASNWSKVNAEAVFPARTKLARINIYDLFVKDGTTNKFIPTKDEIESDKDEDASSTDSSEDKEPSVAGPADDEDSSGDDDSKPLAPPPAKRCKVLPATITAEKPGTAKQPLKDQGEKNASKQDDAPKIPAETLPLNPKAAICQKIGWCGEGDIQWATILQ